MNVGLILAAGRGTRFGGDRPKQFQILNDVPVLQYSIRVFERVELVSSYGIVTTEDEQSTVREMLDRVGAGDCRFVRPGGERRRDSVRRGLEEFEAEHPSTVLAHDAARPGLVEDLLERLYHTWHNNDDMKGVVPVLPLRNTIKQIEPDTGRVEKTLDRDRLRAVQTPQLFDFERLLDVHRSWQPERPVTDDASMLEARGDVIQTVPGLERNAKITRPGDLEVLSRRMEAEAHE